MATTDQQDQKAAQAAERKAEQERKRAEAKAEKERKQAEAKVERDRKREEAKVDRERKAKERAEEKARKAEERKNRPKKAPMTLSQRRACLKLADGPVQVRTDFNRAPLDYLVSVGLAAREDVEVEVEKPAKKEGEEPTKEKHTESRYTLTDTGTERAKELNPKWKTWRPESPEGDGSTQQAA